MNQESWSPQQAGLPAQVGPMIAMLPSNQQTPFSGHVCYFQRTPLANASRKMKKFKGPGPLMGHGGILQQPCPMKAPVPDYSRNSDSAPQSVSGTNNWAHLSQAVREQLSHLAGPKPCDTMWPLGWGRGGGGWVGRKKIRDLLVIFSPNDPELLRIVRFGDWVTLPKRGLMLTVLYNFCALDALLLKTEQGLYSLHVWY